MLLNRKEFSITPQTQDSNCEININPRGGIFDITAGGKDLFGTVYDMNLTNKSVFPISEWKIRIAINDSCFLSMAWFGTVEIHQKAKDGFNVQTLDLRFCDESEVYLNHLTSDSEMLISETIIPLQKGDYIIYYPSKKYKEFPIKKPKTLFENPKARSHSIPCVMFYSENPGRLDFSDVEVFYRSQHGFFLYPILIALAVMFFVWILFFDSDISVSLRTKAMKLRMKQDEHIIEQSISVLTHFVEAKDMYTNGHSYRVAQYSKLITESLGFPEDYCRHIYYIALLHDCGKVYIPDAILKKTGRLTDEEFEIIKTHTIKGAEMLEGFDSVSDIKDGALYHHERYDGKGYPTGKRGEEIPLVGRIICVADAFDAMSSNRCYRKKLSLEVIVSEIKDNIGKQFDPVIARCFLKLIEEGKIGI